ncbi:sensor histidine kinase [Ferruginibacter sp. HRS2-29]|uniref:sensor histidine kinase n=1 Tax=Ferruginibacter sp. HRS2-29 TaxID=2487334 RepID=UPI0020CBF841|nr:sensor histidine kinase [Ferruginibacter sp. HRS2-29]MCP9752088.1 sensor histidine kinase [Ferruginibacter sp. HRS2-29]
MHESYRDIQEGLTNQVKTGTAIFLTLAALFIFFIVFSMLKKRKLMQEQKDMQSQFTQSLLQTRIEIQEQTLRTISQEIHDNVGQILSLAKLNLATLEFGEGEKKELKIKNATQLVGKAINDLRDLSRSMNGDKVADLGLKDAIDNELKIVKNTEVFDTELIVQGKPFRLPPQNEMVLFRIVQESIHNTVKHSKATLLRVTIEHTEGLLRIAVQDDGKGFDADKLEASETGIGLKNMKNRASLIGARFSIQSFPGGTSVFIELPYTNS